MRNDDVLAEVGVSELGSCTSRTTQSTRSRKQDAIVSSKAYSLRGQQR
jgi:hypothetical protein